MTTKANDLFHPLEVSICGHSGSGKTTLSIKLIERFSKNLSVGYIKHDAHRFEMDREGKDTFRAKEAGANQVAISSPEKTALIITNSNDRFLIKQNYIDSDVVIIEGYKDSLCSKILVWSGTSEDEALLERYLSNPKQHLLAIVGAGESGPSTKVPYFQRDDIEGIYNFIDLFWKEKINSRPLNALILSGGHSKRMGKDKGALEYHGKSQVAHLYELLDTFTDNTFVSCRTDQVSSSHIQNFPSITDHYVGFGPTGGILSAFQEQPDAAWFVLACDMPFVNERSIQELIEKRNPYRMVTCFNNSEKKWPEPLCAIYEPKAATKLGYYLAMGKPCPRKVLMNSRVECLDPVEERILQNANTPQDFQNIQSSMIGERHGS
ncbi:MAG: bifunctional molybdenum cofactor guanylyltransferase MobA/molybdopterin-guanine dinucleotide biosynthesis adaptor protein MobB [Bacteriovoracaceae bacterium]|nr:bifunctional molybdenum cofactor guanylyltransferase MobA/molybdopterin-guanine dinucleotide biosynthesis adaptor protein MobB [Bacteriovoracaceae bacterium]